MISRGLLLVWWYGLALTAIDDDVIRARYEEDYLTRFARETA